MIKNESVPVRISLELVNMWDENAILAYACPGNSWQPIGYIPKVKVVKPPKLSTETRSQAWTQLLLGNSMFVQLTVSNTLVQYPFPRTENGWKTETLTNVMKLFDHSTLRFTCTFRGASSLLDVS